MRKSLNFILSVKASTFVGAFAFFAVRIIKTFLLKKKKDAY